MTPPWYDVRPLAAGLPGLGDAFVPLSGGDYQCGVTEDVSIYVHGVTNEDEIMFIWVGLAGGINEASVWKEVVEDWSQPIVARTSLENYLAIEFGGGEGEGFVWDVVDHRAGVLTVVKNKTTLLGRILFGNSGQVESLLGVTVPLWMRGADEEAGYMYFDEQAMYVYLDAPVERLARYEIVGFNMPLSGPKVTGGEASSGIPCPAKGGDYGIVFSTPDIQFTAVDAFTASSMWLHLAPAE